VSSTSLRENSRISAIEKADPILGEECVVQEILATREGGMMNLRALAKEAQKLQKRMQLKQEELLTKRVEGTSGGGMVKAVCDGMQNLVEIKIDPGVVDPSDVEMLEDLVLAAVTEARTAAAKLQAEELGGLAGGLGMPGLSLQ
jgi:DNA-binding YbaB/EbfC family protein